MARLMPDETAREITAEEFKARNSVSETAANRSNRLFGSSGAMDYAVLLSANGAQKAVVVNAATGDDAAEKAAARHPGHKVAYVGPASDTIPNIEVE